MDRKYSLNFNIQDLANLCVDDVADVDIGTIAFRGSFEGQIGQWGRLAGANVHPEEVPGLRCDDAYHVFALARDVALRMRVDPVDKDPAS